MLKQLAEVVKYRGLLYYLVTSSLKTRYRNSWIGFLWTLLNPLIFMVVLWAVFSKMTNSNEKNFALFLLSGIIVWNFFSQTIESGLDSVLSQRSLLQKIYVPKLVFPLAVVTANLVNFIFFLISYFIISPFTAVGIPKTAFLIFPCLLMVYMLSLGGALIAGTLNVFYRDFTHLVPAILRILFYATPVIYNVEFLGPGAEKWLRYNPAYYPVIVMRDVIYYGTSPSLSIWFWGFVSAFAWLLLGLGVFLRSEQKFIYYA